MITTHLSCRCGKVKIETIGPPIIAAECCCNSCRDAAGRMARLDGAPQVLTSYGATPFVLQRKDRIRFTSGMEQLAEFRLKPDSSTRRVVATCCNTPVFLEFKGGHWLSLYAGLWPMDSRPRATLRTVTGDLPDPSVLPADMKNGRGQAGFYARLLGAWIAMGFRSPEVAVGRQLQI